MATKILYLSYTGMTEPLGQSQVLSYLRGLSRYFDISLLSFEKNINESKEFDQIKSIFKKNSINWVFYKYGKTPKRLRTVFNIIKIFLFVSEFLFKNRKNTKNLIHCRSYIVTIPVFFLSYIVDIKYIFDMRALWVDEHVSSNRLKKNGWQYRALKMLEERMLKKAYSIVTLTEASSKYLSQLYGISLSKFSTITTCVDLKKFKARKSNGENLNIGVFGTITSDWFVKETLFKYITECLKLNKNIKVTFITRDDPNKIKTYAKKFNLINYTIRSANPNEVPFLISKFDISPMFFKSDLGKLGSAPTRLGELLACGVPVVCNDGIGDMSNIVKKYNVGLVLEEGSSIYDIAKTSIEIMEKKIDLYQNCINAAEDYFSLSSGIRSYKQIYDDVI